jgi:membrane protease YdiL (CAAX protease family)
MQGADRSAAPEPLNGLGPTAPLGPAAKIPRWGLGAFVLVESVRLAVSGGLLVFLAHNRPVTVSMVTVALAVPTVTAALLAVAITTWRGNGPRTDLRLRWSWRAVGLGVLFGIGGFFVTLPASRIYIKLAGPHASSALSAAFAGARASWPVAVVVFLLVALVAPFCEEIVYRGMLWGAVERRWGRWVALAATTVVFALAHLEFSRFPLLLVVAIPIGLARLYSGNLTASVVVHQMTNLVPATYLMLTIAGTLPPSY